MIQNNIIDDPNYYNKQPMNLVFSRARSYSKKQPFRDLRVEQSEPKQPSWLKPINTIPENFSPNASYVSSKTKIDTSNLKIKFRQPFSATSPIRKTTSKISASVSEKDQTNVGNWWNKYE